MRKRNKPEVAPRDEPAQIRKPTDEELEDRRLLANTWRRVRGWTYEQIVQGFASLTPPIHVTSRTVRNYLSEQTERNNRELRRDTFNVRDWFATHRDRFEYQYRWAIREATRPGIPPKESRRWFITAMQAQDRNIKLHQECGLVDKTLGILLFGRSDLPGATGERTPNGEELKRWFDGVEITEGEIVSDAERARRYGEQRRLPPAADHAAKPNGSGERA